MKSMGQMELFAAGYLPEETDAANIDTATGRVPLRSLGRVLMHEHVFCRVRAEHLGPAQSAVSSWLSRAFDHGVRTIVDLTTYVLPDAFMDALVKSPVRVICCAGFYLKRTIPAPYRQLGASGLTDKLLGKFENGIGKYRIKPGIIKVATSGRSFTRLEKDILTAAAIVQGNAGVPIATHACRGGRAQLALLMEAGADPRRVFLSHTEMELKGKWQRSFDDVSEDVLWMLARGAYIFLGDFSVQDSEYRRSVIRLLKACIDNGYSKQLFLSTDCYWSYRKGGMRVRGSAQASTFPRTYDYLFTLIIPLLRKHGFSDKDFDDWLIANPRRFFSANP